LKTRVVLVEPEHDGNIGLIARAMKNFGYDDLWLVNPQAELGLEARMLASHAQDLLAKAKVVANLEDALDKCDYAVATTAIVSHSRSNLNRRVLTLTEFAQKAASVKSRVAILFGRESQGLLNTEIARCDLVVNIPTRGSYRTLNIAAAVSITLYELKTTRARRISSIENADKEVRERLLETFEDLERMVDLPHHRVPLARRALSNVMSRGLISEREATLIIGVLRRATDKIRIRR
jgi:tRNA/rRNA methyltransferase